MRALLAGIGALALISASAVAASASSLQVAPTTLDMTAPSSASVLNLRNEAKKPTTVQVRVFRWTQKNGVEKLEPTSTVVASPPVIKLAPNQDYVVRVMRVGKAPIAGEESYRVLVDEVPVKSDIRPGNVKLVVRQSIPVFFRSPEATAPQVSWTVQHGKKGAMLVARNEGSSRMRLVNLQATQNGKSLTKRSGLVGYILGGSTMAFPLGAKKIDGAPVLIKAIGDLGPIDAKAAIKG